MARILNDNSCEPILRLLPFSSSVRLRLTVAVCSDGGNHAACWIQNQSARTTHFFGLGSATAQLLPGKMPSTGLWYNPERPGHGFDLHQAGDQLFMVWYTFDENGVPVWYTAQGSFATSVWSADLLRFTWDLSLIHI